MTRQALDRVIWWHGESNRNSQSRPVPSRSRVYRTRTNWKPETRSQKWKTTKRRVRCLRSENRMWRSWSWWRCRLSSLFGVANSPHTFLYDPGKGKVFLVANLVIFYPECTVTSPMQTIPSFPFIAPPRNGERSAQKTHRSLNGGRRFRSLRDLHRALPLQCRE